ncbi:hypothetical protein BH11PLA1_BH11PLA1_09480 [soil metagenome]
MALSGNEVIPKRRYHVHGPLITYIGVSLLVAVGAFHSQNNLLFWLFGFSLGLMLVSGFVSGTMLMGVRVERTSTPDARAGERITIGYRVGNRSRVLPLMALTINEVYLGDENRRKERPWWNTPIWRFFLPKRARKGGARAGAGTSAPADGGGGPALFPGASERTAALEYEPAGFIAFVPRRGEAEFQSAALCLAPGRLRLAGIQVSTAFPFGIILKSLYFPIPAAAVVVPAGADLALDLATRGRGTPVPMHESWQQPGAGDEFFGLREYTSGDSPRLIAWKRSAVQDRLLVRQSGGAAPGRLFVSIHIAPDGSAPEFDAAIAAGAQALRLGAAEGMATGLLVPQAGIERQARATLSHLTGLVETLALLAVEPTQLARPIPAAYGPARLQDGDRVVVIHVGTPDGRLGTRGAVHLRAGVTQDGALFARPIASSRAADREAAVQELRSRRSVHGAAARPEPLNSGAGA